MMSRRRFALAVAVATVCSGLAVAVAAPGAPAATTTTAAHTTNPATATGPLHVQGSVAQVAVTGGRPGTSAVLLDSGGRAVAHKQLDALGSALFRSVQPGTGYVVTVGGTRGNPVDVMSPADTPPPSFYSSQQIGPGFGYLKTRDGTLLSVNVSLPGPVQDGPYPTVVEYSGYDPSNPDGRQPASTLAGILGFATVGVNMRGTGCSGGAFDYFEELQSLDGYDAIEAIAAQPWVANGKVGMVGISYPGITQLFVAATRPPHLAAITPLSVIDDTYETLYPGGIFNNGFALGWANERASDARPAGQGWAASRIAKGDSTCKANQALRLQSPNVLGEIKGQKYYDPTRSPALAPASFVHNIDVPVFLAGSWQDEETGAHFADMLGDFAPGVSVKFTLMNGVHSDSLGAPTVLSRWIEFLDFYVAQKIPSVPQNVRDLASTLLSRFYGAGVSLAPDRFTGYTDYQSALAAYQAEPAVRVLFDMGAGGPPGAPVPSFEADLPSWPPLTTTATTWYAQAGGALDATAPMTSTGSDTFRYDPSAFPRTDAGSSGKSSDSASTIEGFGSAPKFNWKPVPKGKAVAYVTAPLAQDTVIAGTGSVDLWLQTRAPDLDLEVTISEVRPDGQETYVQSGWLRASERKVDPATSTALLPVPTHTKADAEPIPAGTPTLVRVPLFPFAHAFRAGSRIRIVVQPPGGNRPSWAFADLGYPQPPAVSVLRTAAHPTQVVLPVVSGIPVPTPLPACGTLRGQPCRRYAGP
jgi:predicted acyl esterase